MITQTAHNNLQEDEARVNHQFWTQDFSTLMLVDHAHQTNSYRLGSLVNTLCGVRRNWRTWQVDCICGCQRSALNGYDRPSDIRSSQ